MAASPRASSVEGEGGIIRAPEQAHVRAGKGRAAATGSEIL